jgi:hypothetical protein
MPLLGVGGQVVPLDAFAAENDLRLARDPGREVLAIPGGRVPRSRGEEVLGQRHRPGRPVAGIEQRAREVLVQADRPHEHLRTREGRTGVSA